MIEDEEIIKGACAWRMLKLKYLSYPVMRVEEQREIDLMVFEHHLRYLPVISECGDGNDLDATSVFLINLLKQGDPLLTA